MHRAGVDGRGRLEGEKVGAEHTGAVKPEIGSENGLESSFAGFFYTVQ